LKYYSWENCTGQEFRAQLAQLDRCIEVDSHNGLYLRVACENGTCDYQYFGDPECSEQSTMDASPNTCKAIGFYDGLKFKLIEIDSQGKVTTPLSSLFDIERSYAMFYDDTHIPNTQDGCSESAFYRRNLIIAPNCKWYSKESDCYPREGLNIKRFCETRKEFANSDSYIDALDSFVPSKDEKYLKFVLHYDTCDRLNLIAIDWFRWSMIGNSETTAICVEAQKIWFDGTRLVHQAYVWNDSHPCTESMEGKSTNISVSQLGECLTSDVFYYSYPLIYEIVGGKESSPIVPIQAASTNEGKLAMVDIVGIIVGTIGAIVLVAAVFHSSIQRSVKNVTLPEMTKYSMTQPQTFVQTHTMVETATGIGKWG
jgi:hypothetical protein